MIRIMIIIMIMMMMMMVMMMIIITMMAMIVMMIMIMIIIMIIMTMDSFPELTGTYHIQIIQVADLHLQARTPYNLSIDTCFGI